MAERFSPADLERGLAALGSSIDYPPTPNLGSAVTSRLLAERQARRRPPFPGLALWPRRRVLLLAAALVLLLAATAWAARTVIGAVEIRVLPEGSTPAAAAPFTGSELGPSVTMAAAQSAVRFPILAPPGLGPPTQVHVARAGFAARLVVLDWDPDAIHARIPGTTSGTILVELPADKGVIAYKELAASTPLQAVRVGGHNGFWISGPHDLSFVLPGGTQRFSIGGNVLLWQQDGTTFRLETSLDRAGAIALATSMS